MKRYSNNFGRRGLTLIEVLAALTILSTVLALVLVARARTVRQTTLADAKLKACEVAKEQVRAWLDKPESLPRPGEGEAGNLRWRSDARLIRDKRLGQRAEIVNVSFSQKTNPNVVLLSLDLCLPRVLKENR